MSSDKSIDWFDTIDAWPGGDRAGTELAAAVVQAGLVGSPTSTFRPAEPSFDATRPAPVMPPAPPGPAEAFTPVDPPPSPPWATEAPTKTEPVTPVPSTPRTPRSWILFPVVAIAGVIVVVGVIAYALFGSDGPEPTATPAPPAPSTTASSAAPGVQCPSRSSAGVTTGADAGDQNSGPGVIKAFNYAYYVTRNAEQAAGVALVGAVATPQEMQTFIDERPEGTTHCLRITDLGEGSYAVELTEAPPGDGAPTVFRQIINTTEAQGKTWIVEIRPDR